jgi:hypothetical protein
MHNCPKICIKRVSGSEFGEECRQTHSEHESGVHECTVRTGMWTGMESVWTVRILACKPRQGCLLGPKVPDSDRGVETVIFR